MSFNGFVENKTIRQSCNCIKKNPKLFCSSRCKRRLQTTFCHGDSRRLTKWKQYEPTLLWLLNIAHRQAFSWSHSCDDNVCHAQASYLNIPPLWPCDTFLSLCASNVFLILGQNMSHISKQSRPKSQSLWPQCDSDPSLRSTALVWADFLRFRSLWALLSRTHLEAKRTPVLRSTALFPWYNAPVCLSWRWLVSWKQAAVTLYTSPKNITTFSLNVLISPLGIYANHLLSTGGCHQHSVWLRHPSKNGELLTETYHPWTLELSSASKSHCNKTVKELRLLLLFCLMHVFWLHEVIRYSTLGTISLFQYVSQLLALQNTAAGSPSALRAVWYYSRRSNALGI